MLSKRSQMLLWLLSHCLSLTISSSSTISHISSTTQFIKINDLADIFKHDDHPILEPSFISGKKAEHDIHITDDFGKFYTLRYKTRIPDHFNVMHLDDMPFETVECGNNSDIMNITFKNTRDAVHYYDIITNDGSFLSTHFIVASRRWQCHNKPHFVFSSFIGEIVDYELNSNILSVTVIEAAFTELFEDLKITFRTNHLMHHKPIQTKSRRRLDSEECSFEEVPYEEKPRHPFKRRHHCLKEHSAVECIGKFFESAVGVIASLFKGGTVHSRKAVAHLWDTFTGVINAITHLVLDDEVPYKRELFSFETNCNNQELPHTGLKCEECYFKLNLHYIFELEIKGLSVKYFKAGVEGNIDIGAVVNWEKDDTVEMAYKTRTKEKETGIWINLIGIDFQLKVMGELVVGVVFHESMKVGATLHGKIDASVERYGGNAFRKGDPRYVDKTLKIEPVVHFSSNDRKMVRTYVSMSLYLIIDMIGSLHVTLQPIFDVALEPDFTNHQCKSVFKDSMKVHFYVGGAIEIHLKWPTGVVHILTIPDVDLTAAFLNTALKSWDTIHDGASQKTKITKHEGFDCVPGANHLKTTESGSNNGRRRQLVNVAVDDRPYFNTADIVYKYDTAETVWHPDFKWGQNFTVWRANLTLLEESCPISYHKTVTGSETFRNMVLPDSAHIFVWSEENEGDELMALYTVSKQLLSDDGFLVDNATNITCSFTYLLTKVPGIYSPEERVYRYNASLYVDEDGDDTVCNNNISLIYDDHGDLFVTFTLPPILDAVFLDPSFGTILLTDDNWLHCHSFVLSQDDVQYDFNDTFTKSDAMKLIKNTEWHGAFHCVEWHNNYTETLTLSFDYIDIMDNNLFGDVSVTLVDVDHYAYGDGVIDLTHINSIHLRINITGWFQQENGNTTWDEDNIDTFEMIGFINIFETGWLSYSGVFYENGSLSDCTGFVFQSYIHEIALDDEDEVDVEGDESNEFFCIHEEAKLSFLIMGGVLCFIFVTLIILLMCTCCKLRRISKDVAINKATVQQDL